MQMAKIKVLARRIKAFVLLSVALLATSRYIALWAIYALCRLSPRRPKIAVFGAFPGSAEDNNSKHLCKYTSANYPHMRCVWIANTKDEVLGAREEGIASYTRTSFNGILHCLFASNYFFTHYISDISFFLSNGACLVNLWHGPPMKMIEFDNRVGPSSKRYISPTFYQKYIGFPWVYKRPSYIVSTSSYVARYALMSAFRLKYAQCLNLGEPRLDAWTCNDPKPASRPGSWQTYLMKEMRGMKILYMPTWRDSGKSLSELGVDRLEDIERFCHLTDSRFFIKPHLWTQFKNSSDARSFTRLHVIEGSAEMYYAMQRIDCLVSDYSSIMPEWTITNKPLICLSLEQEDYEGSERSLYFKPEEVPLGHMANGVDELISILSNLAASNPDKRDKGYSDQTVSLFHDFISGSASQRISEYFFGAKP